MPLVQRMMMLLWRESLAQKSPLGLPVQMIVPLSLMVNCALAIAADATRSVAVYFILIVFKIEYSKAGASVCLVAGAIESECVCLLLR